MGIITSKSVVLSDISEELKDNYTTASEPSKIKRLFRFFTNDNFDAECVYYNFAYNLLKRAKLRDKKAIVIFDHTIVEDKFLILQFSLKIGKGAVPLLYKTFYYNDKNNKNFEHVKEGLSYVYKILKPHNFHVILLADRGFKSVDLFEFIDKTLKWKYCIRCTKDIFVQISDEVPSKKLEYIKPYKHGAKHFKDVLLTNKKYLCNLAVCKAEDADDTWFIINNLVNKDAIREYKKRFDIEEMFRDLKFNSFNLESTWTEKLTYMKNLFLCVSVAYAWIIILGVSCSKDNKQCSKKSKRIYSIFRTGLKWFKRCYNYSRKHYYLKFDFVLYSS